jgi:hypothetical protein
MKVTVSSISHDGDQKSKIRYTDFFEMISEVPGQNFREKDKNWRELFQILWEVRMEVGSLWYLGYRISQN